MHPIFKEGDIITNGKNGFKRLIIGIQLEERNGKSSIVYYYQGEELDSLLNPTGNFDHGKGGSCTQTHLKQWQKGR